MKQTNPDYMKKFCVIYVRVSSEKQVDGYSLDSQVDLCRKRAEQMGFDVAEIFREEGVSGRTIARPKLQEMLAYCRNRKNNVSALIIYSLSRLNRNTENHIVIRNLLSKSGVDLISLSEPTDTSPVGKFIETVFAAKDQLENETRAINVANSLRRRFLEGNITSRPGIGYLMVKINGKSTAQIDPASFEILQSMWYKIANEGWSLQKVAEELNRLKISYSGNRRFKKFTAKYLSKVFSNKFYMGILVSERYGETEGQHLAMVTPELFYRVRAVIMGRKPAIKRIQNLREDFKLRKIIRCRFCNRFLTSSWVQGRSKKYPKYYCTERKSHLNVSFDRDIVEEEYMEMLKRVTYDKDFLVFYTEFIEEKYHIQYAQLTESYKQVEQDIIMLKKAQKIAREKNVSGLYTDEEYKEMRDDYEIQIVDKQGLLAEKKSLKVDIKVLMKFIVYYLSHTGEVWLNASPEGRVAIGGSIFPDGITFDGKTTQNRNLGLAYKLIDDFKNATALGEPAGIRTQDQELKRLLLYH
jgi:site-specific DNA recombinase